MNRLGYSLGEFRCLVEASQALRQPGGQVGGFWRRIPAVYASNKGFEIVDPVGGFVKPSQFDMRLTKLREAVYDVFENADGLSGRIGAW